MKKHILFFIGILLVSSCNKENQKATILEDDKSSQVTSVDQSEQARTNASQMLLPNQPVSQTINQQQNIVPTNVGNSGGAGINPPHGQPGHRCDIAVGAPLNSTQTTQNVAPTNAPQNIEINPTSQKVSTKVNTAVGMNPAHGEPGHRCDIAVGAPLNSPKQDLSKTVTSQDIELNPTPAPQKVETAPGMNPPHGEPGHRCDISVGAPLNSAPEVKAN